MRVLVVDDEPWARRRLAEMVDAEQGHRVVAEAGTGEQALAATREHQPDLILLDIQMPGMDGLEVARRIARRERPPGVIFITAHPEHALAAFEAEASDYLLKPVRPDRLRAALARAGQVNRAQLQGLRRPHADPGMLRCRTTRGERLVPLDRIHSLRAEDKYVVVGHDDGELLLEDSLKALEQRFADRFLRVHRSALVALDRLQALERDALGRHQVVLQGGLRLPVSRRHLPAVRDALRRLAQG
ncbi:LytR/AlgR family response regulator transcription factor [Alkalilimnicola ehrlichii]|uniref:LytR/AlgR family response regulator transcription factor n=1 Tax=Alkalilimnicola ehrlichii TaxID=351052 RepID=UPI003B9FA59A